VQFSELAALFGDFQTARLVHFLGMAAIVGFLVVHVTLALLVPRTLAAMVTGGPYVPHDSPPDMDRPPPDERLSVDAAPPNPQPAHERPENIAP
jgi:hypothetical protein